jgi:hypothetical protein
MSGPVFIVGCPRSGTTLLRDLLCSHPRITIPPESHFIPLFERAFGDPGSDEAAWRLARHILATPRVAAWEITAGREDFAGLRSFSQVTRRVFELWAAKQGKPRWGDKTPHYVRDIPLLLHLFPDSRVIHIIRDGRDVALSWLRTRLEPRNLYMAARLWREMVERGRQDGARLGAGAYLELRYEALLAEPEASMRSVCAFLGEAFDPAVLRPTRLESDRRRFEGRRQVFAKSIIADNTGKWASAMSSRERARFESVAGALLAELGYPVEGLGRRLSRVEELFWEVDHGCRHVAGIFRRLRKARERRAAAAIVWAKFHSLLSRRG